MKTYLALLLFLLALLFCGCASPPSVRLAQTLEARGVDGYAANAERFQKLWERAYVTERTAHIDYTIAQASKEFADALAAKPENKGRLTPAQAVLVVKTALERKASLDTDTMRVVAGIRRLQAANEKELAKVRQLRDALSEWSAAGPTMEMAGDLVDNVLAVIEQIPVAERPVPLTDLPEPSFKPADIPTGATP